MADCLFCKIIEGQIPSAKVYEDEDLLGFKDIAPQAPVHILFIPKKHFASLDDLPAQQSAVMSKIFTALTQVAREQGLSKDGYRALINVGKHGGQVVHHLHVHLIGGRHLGPLVSAGG